MIIKRKINFDLKSSKGTRSRIRMRVSYKGNRIEFQTGILIDPDSWDAAHQRVKSYNSGVLASSQLNDQLAALSARMIEIFKKFELLNKVPTPQELRLNFNSSIENFTPSVVTALPETQNISVPITETKTFVQKEKGKSLWEAYDEFVKVNGKLNDGTDATFEKFAALKNHLLTFNEKLTFDKFDENGIADFVDHLSKKRKLKNSTINKQLGFLRWFLRWSYERGYNKNHTFEYFKPKLKSATKRVIFLTHEELEKVEKFVAPKGKETLNIVRDAFLFSCYTGLRYSDVEKLTWDDIHDNKIEIVTKKTTDRLLIEFNKKSLAILSKYHGVHLPGRKVLPVLTNQKMNKRLKELCKLAGIDEKIKLTYYEGNKRFDEVKPKYELVGTHTGRRTFICTALAKGIPPSIVMKWTGHSDYKAMKPYIDVADEVKSEYMKKFDE